MTVENFQGGFKAGRHLLQQEQKQIAVVRGPLNVESASERVRGFLHALSEKKITISREYIQVGAFDRETGYNRAIRLLRLVPGPTAIFAASDHMAVGALMAIKASKFKCPQDVSRMSFDGLSFTEFTEPALTSISQTSY